MNFASRVEGLNKQFGTAISRQRRHFFQVQHRFRFKAVGSVAAQGMTNETRVFELVGALARVSIYEPRESDRSPLRVSRSQYPQATSLVMQRFSKACSKSVSAVAPLGQPASIRKARSCCSSQGA